MNTDEEDTDKIIEGILAQEAENSEININKVREFMRKAIREKIGCPICGSREHFCGECENIY